MYTKSVGMINFLHSNFDRDSLWGADRTETVKN